MFERLRALLLAAVLIAAAPVASATGASAAPLAADPVLEARVVAIAQELRCLVCQNETIAASNADLAVDLRKQIRQKLQRGESPQQIVDFMVARYGDFVLYRPPVKPTTWFLWAGPFVLLLVAALTLARQLRLRKRRVAAVELSDEERQRADALLAPPTAASPAATDPAR
jgi:cytochrome c-type biogenesis protein CcmH